MKQPTVTRESNQIKIIFFGSTSDSVIVLEKLVTCHLSLVALRLAAVVTQPPRPVGRDQVLTPTPVDAFAKTHTIPVLSFPSHQEKPWLFENDDAVADALAPFKADLVISASYGIKIPDRTLKETRFAGLNVHPSILPRWRGADPVPWAILAGDHQTGVTIVSLSDTFDTGEIIAQKKIPITDKDTSDPLRTKLFTIGADLLVESLPDYMNQKHNNIHQHYNNKTIEQLSSYARKFTREDGFLPWELIEEATRDKGPSFAKATAGRQETRTKQVTIEQFNNVTIVKDYLKFRNKNNPEISLGAIIERFFRALTPWPGVYTMIETRDKGPSFAKATAGRQETRKTKRLKILACHLSHVSSLILDTVQLEGKKPVSWDQFKKAYLS
jgi:methionyl-tRNA formyltransferase